MKLPVKKIRRPLFALTAAAILLYGALSGLAKVIHAQADGDVVPDGQLNAADLSLMYRMVLGESPPDLAGDLYPPGTGDGVIDLSDLILHQQLVLQNQNLVPVAVDDPAAGSAPENTLLRTDNVLANDTLVDNAVISAFDNPSVNGGLVEDKGDGTFDYTPALDFNGTDSFTYTLTDDQGDSDTATVTVTVTPVNAGTPVAADDPAAGSAPENTRLRTANVLANDTLVDNAAISAFDNPSVNGGLVENKGDGTFDYTPAVTGHSRPLFLSR